MLERGHEVMATPVTMSKKKLAAFAKRRRNAKLHAKVKIEATKRHLQLDKERADRHAAHMEAVKKKGAEKISKFFG
jgi:hypothetical protein